MARWMWVPHWLTRTWTTLLLAVSPYFQRNLQLMVWWCQLGLHHQCGKARSSKRLHVSNKIKSCSHDAQIAMAIVLLSGFALSGKEFFSRFYSNIRNFLFFYLSNADVENCGSFKSFGFIYIYIYIYIDEYQALHKCSLGDWVCIKSSIAHSLLSMFFLLFLFLLSFSFDPLSNALPFSYIPLPLSYLYHLFLPNLLPFLTLVTFHIWRRWWKESA